MTTFPQWCLLCAAQAFDNSCGHFPGPLPSMAARCERGPACTSEQSLCTFPKCYARGGAG